MENSKYHDWVEWKFHKLTLVCCNRCGRVCKSDGSNAYDPCKGKVGVALRGIGTADPLLADILDGPDEPEIKFIKPGWEMKQFALPSDVFRAEVLQNASNKIEQANSELLKKLFADTDKYLLDLTGHTPESYSKLSVQEKVELSRMLQDAYNIEIETSHSYDDPMRKAEDPYVMTVSVHIYPKENQE